MYTLGQYGEAIATVYLQEKRRYQILEKNFRIWGIEVDIISKVDYNLIFVEVKTWKTYSEDTLSLSITHKKLHRMRMAADAYVHRYRNLCRDIQALQVDIVFINPLQHLIRHWEGIYIDGKT